MDLTDAAGDGQGRAVGQPGLRLLFRIRVGKRIAKIAPDPKVSCVAHEGGDIVLPPASDRAAREIELHPALQPTLVFDARNLGETLCSRGIAADFAEIRSACN